MMDWTLCDAVERDREKVSGAWIFRGTRVPVTALFEKLEGGASIDDFLSWFPGGAREQVVAVLEYEAKDKMRQYEDKRYIENFILGTPPLSVRELRKRLIEEKSAENLHLRHSRYLKEVKQEAKREKASLRRLK
jgi:uncharacterized protein (DUF433 family)